MTFSKQGILVSHAIALTVLLLIVVAWKTPSSQESPFSINGQSHVQNPSTAVFL